MLRALGTHLSAHALTHTKQSDLDVNEPYKFTVAAKPHKALIGLEANYVALKIID